MTMPLTGTRWVIGPIALSALLAACGGGGGSGGSGALSPSAGADGGLQVPADDGLEVGDPGDDGTGGTTTPAAGGGAARIAALPGAGDTLTGAADLVVSNDGSQHAVMTDRDGQLFYLACSSRCDDQDRWAAVALASFDIGLTGYAVGQLGVAADGSVHVGVISRARSTGSSLFSSYYCAGDCASRNAWQGELTGQSGVGFLKQRVADIRWFSLGPDGLPRLATLEEPSLGARSATLFLSVCTRAPCGENDWQFNEVLDLPGAGSTPVNLVHDADGSMHMAIDYRRTFEDRVQLGYVACRRDCDAATPVFDDVPALVGTYDRVDNAQARTRLAIDPDGRPTVLLVDHPAGAARFTAFGCDGPCSVTGSDDGEWRAVRPLDDVDGAGNLGRGLDAALVDGELRVVLPVAVEGDRLASQLLMLACAGDCSRASAWQGGSVASTLGLEYPDINGGEQGGCIYGGTEIAPPLRVTGPAGSYTLVSTFYCNVVPENPELLDASDIRTFPFAVVQQFR